MAVSTTTAEDSPALGMTVFHGDFFRLPDIVLKLRCIAAVVKPRRRAVGHRGGPSWTPTLRCWIADSSTNLSTGPRVWIRGSSDTPITVTNRRDQCLGRAMGQPRTDV